MAGREQVKRLFEQHYRDMYRLAVIMLHDGEESRDIIADVFTRLLEHPLQVEDSTARSYLMQSVRRRCLNVLRGRALRERVARLLPIEQEEDEWSVNVFEEQNVLRHGVNMLEPPICRDIIVLRFRYGLKFHEIASRLGISETTVYKHLRQALSQLRIHLKNV